MDSNHNIIRYYIKYQSFPIVEPIDQRCTGLNVWLQTTISSKLIHQCQASRNTTSKDKLKYSKIKQDTKFQVAKQYTPEVKQRLKQEIIKYAKIKLERIKKENQILNQERVKMQHIRRDQQRKRIQEDQRKRIQEEQRKKQQAELRNKQQAELRQRQRLQRQQNAQIEKKKKEDDQKMKKQQEKILKDRQEQQQKRKQQEAIRIPETNQRTPGNNLFQPRTQNQQEPSRNSLWTNHPNSNRVITQSNQTNQSMNNNQPISHARGLFSQNARGIGTQNYSFNSNLQPPQNKSTTNAFKSDETYRSDQQSSIASGLSNNIFPSNQSNQRVTSSTAVNVPQFNPYVDQCPSGISRDTIVNFLKYTSKGPNNQVNSNSHSLFSVPQVNNDRDNREKKKKTQIGPGIG